jgi:hypothetical protein
MTRLDAGSGREGLQRQNGVPPCFGNLSGVEGAIGRHGYDEDGRTPWPAWEWDTTSREYTQCSEMKAGGAFDPGALAQCMHFCRSSPNRGSFRIYPSPKQPAVFTYDVVVPGYHFTLPRCVRLSRSIDLSARVHGEPKCASPERLSP